MSIGSFYKASASSGLITIQPSTADLKAFMDLNRSSMAKDRDGNPVYMAKTAWDVGYVADRYPKVKFAATRER